MTEQRYNKGEWSETYTLIKLLAEGKLHGADANLNALPNIFYPLINVIRSEVETNYIYEYDRYSYHESTNIRILDSENNCIVSIPINVFKEKSIKLFEEIKTGKGTFPVSAEVNRFLQTIKVTKKAERSNYKRDITIVVHDEETGHSPELGFSIKSQLGGHATLFNAGHTTNFMYKFIGGPNLTDAEVKEINIDKVATANEVLKGKKVSLNTIKQKEKYGFNENDKLKNTGEIIREMEKLGFTIKFFRTHNEIFQSNLQMFDSNFPFLLSDVLLKVAKNDCGNKMESISAYLDNENPLKYNLRNNHPLYSYKIKNFLTDASLGLMPSQVWEGIYDATGGYIIVKSDGELVCYHIYNRNEFQDYLMKNTYLETGSRFKHGFGFVYRKDGELYLNLNLQIRFNV